MKVGDKERGKENKSKQNREKAKRRGKLGVVVCRGEKKNRNRKIKLKNRKTVPKKRLTE